MRFVTSTVNIFLITSSRRLSVLRLFNLLAVPPLLFLSHSPPHTHPPFHHIFIHFHQLPSENFSYSYTRADPRLLQQRQSGIGYNFISHAPFSHIFTPLMSSMLSNARVLSSTPKRGIGSPSLFSIGNIVPCGALLVEAGCEEEDEEAASSAAASFLRIAHALFRCLTRPRT